MCVCVLIRSYNSRAKRSLQKTYPAKMLEHVIRNAFNLPYFGWPLQAMTLKRKRMYILELYSCRNSPRTVLDRPESTDVGQ